MKRQSQLILLTITITITCACILGFKLGDLMIIEGSQMRERVDENRVFRLTVPAERGLIFDRNKQLLAQNTLHYFLATSSAQRLFGNRWSLPEISADQAFRIMVASPSSIFTVSERSEVTDPAVTHIVGYTGYLGNQELLRGFADERVGRTGIERSMNTILQGKPGLQLLEISAKGVPQRELAPTQKSVAGDSVQLAIDKELSDTAYGALAPAPGAVVVSEVKTGQVLVLTSSPSYQVSSLSAVLKDPQKSLLNRALTAYPPGSTFKPIVALAALRAGKITADTIVDDEGEIKAGTQVFGNWYWRQYGRKEGKISLVRAISRSNDIYFYETAADVGPDKIDTMAKEFGFGAETGVELPSESVGLLPTEAWKEKTTGEKWFLGDTYNMGIGQGYILASPAQVNAMTAAIARGGSWCPLTLLPTKDPTCTDVAIDPKFIETVVEGMVGVCSTGGTAFPFFPLTSTLDADHKIACKTGTAEFGGEDANRRKRTHGWFTMFYPVKDPEVAITVFLESSAQKPYLEGSTDAAPIALKVFQAWREKYEK